MKIMIEYTKTGAIFDAELQQKTFKDEIAAIEWCRKNYKNIASINFHSTFCQMVNHFDLMDYIRERS